MDNLTDPAATETCLARGAAYPAPGDDHARYDGLSIALHWATAALGFLQFGLAETWDFFPKVDRDLLIIGHLSFGLMLAAVIVLRIFWRLTFGRKSCETGQDLIANIARIMHYTLYVLIVAEV